MNIQRHLVAIAASLLATTAWAQTAGKPLNLKLPPGDLPAASATAPQPPTPKTAGDAPGVYYGDTSGRMGNTEPVAGAPDCDDSTYNQPQVHGSVGTGIVTGSHMGTGNWNSGHVSVSQAFGSCDEPSGGVSISVGGSRSHFPDRDHRGR
ncbi:hypothetical protein [Rhodanobacter caeni]|uniref:Secreted protein n=1 Tax=Rhodanobacter caeni TaxID=657654 RepID=A0ABP3ED14_9GAMM